MVMNTSSTPQSQTAFHERNEIQVGPTIQTIEQEKRNSSGGGGNKSSSQRKHSKRSRQQARRTVHTEESNDGLKISPEDDQLSEHDKRIEEYE